VPRPQDFADRTWSKVLILQDRRGGEEVLTSNIVPLKKASPASALLQMHIPIAGADLDKRAAGVEFAVQLGAADRASDGHRQIKSDSAVAGADIEIGCQ